MPVPNDPGRCRTALDPESTLVAVIEMSQSSWLVAAIVPGLERHPLKKLAVDEAGLPRQLERWREEAARAGRRVARIAVAFEAGPAATASGWRAGCGPAASRPTSSTRRASRCPASTAAPRRTGSTPSC